MKTNLVLQKHWKAAIGTIVAIVFGLALAGTYQKWWPLAESWLASGGDADHDEHDESLAVAHPTHAEHDDSESLMLSDIAWKNIGLETNVVTPQSYTKTVSVPALVVERAGRSQVEITTPLTGIVTRIYPIEGEAIQPDQPLFDLRLTHEDLVTAQRDYLRSAQELDVVTREIQRLETVGEGVISGRRVLEQQYEKQKIEAAMHAQRQALLLHALTDEQIAQILDTRQLLTTLTVVAPQFDSDADHHDVQHLYHVQKINTTRGQHVTAGDPLSVLADHCLLYVEGQAFEEDADRLEQAAREGWPVELLPLGTVSSNHETLQSKVLYVADQVDAESRALKFYLGLPNRLTRDEREAEHRFVAWKYRPGQRMRVKIPVAETWEDQIVLPPDAVAIEGPEAFVFEQNGEHFDRVPVHILFRDRDVVVVENDGSLVGSTLAISGAYQMYLALKNKAGGGVDPHAGHGH